MVPVLVANAEDSVVDKVVWTRPDASTVTLGTEARLTPACDAATIYT